MLRACSITFITGLILSAGLALGSETTTEKPAVQVPPKIIHKSTGITIQQIKEKRQKTTHSKKGKISQTKTDCINELLKERKKRQAQPDIKEPLFKDAPECREAFNLPSKKQENPIVLK